MVLARSEKPERQEKTDMRSYKMIIATRLIADILEALPEVGRKLPHAEVAQWMVQYDIEPDDVLFESPDVVMEMLVELIEKSQPQWAHAA